MEISKDVMKQFLEQPAIVVDMTEKYIGRHHIRHYSDEFAKGFVIYVHTDNTTIHSILQSIESLTMFEAAFGKEWLNCHFDGKEILNRFEPYLIGDEYIDFLNGHAFRSIVAFQKPNINLFILKRYSQNNEDKARMKLYRDIFDLMGVPEIKLDRDNSWNTELKTVDTTDHSYTSEFTPM